MTDLEQLEFHPRVFRRRSGAPNGDGSCVVYWMQRAQRANDNAALDIAIMTGNALEKPVVTFFQLSARAYHANLRHYQFMLDGLTELPGALTKRNIGFVLHADSEEDILRFCAAVNPCLVIGDENPLRSAERARSRVAAALRVPFWTVDADVVIPTRLLGKEHYAARTIRPKLHAVLPMFLRPSANRVAKVKWHGRVSSRAPRRNLLDRIPVDRSVPSVPSFAGGAAAARKALASFIRDRLAGYAARRNQPDLEGTSRLSPYLHFGQIDPRVVALTVKKSDAPGIDKKAFLEELIVRRELAMNFVRYNSSYDRFDACEPWADRSLRLHLGDPRQQIYSEKQLQHAETHDALWNAAQKQMVLTGWMHGYLRMYWAKKILEWSPAPAEAFEIAVRLNDRYELDGRDPNGYAGIAWAIVGKHDRAWGPERPVYGKIRYMSHDSTARKFNAKAYITRITALEKGRA